jgi:hypothetical protein
MLERRLSGQSEIIPALRAASKTLLTSWPIAFQQLFLPEELALGIVAPGDIARDESIARDTAGTGAHRATPRGQLYLPDADNNAPTIRRVPPSFQAAFGSASR